MATTPHPTARGLLVWMQTHPGRLRELLDIEAEGQDDLAPAGDPAVRAHLAFTAEALAANAAPGAAEALEAFAAGLPALLRDRLDRVDEEIRRGGEAVAFELELQFRGETADDPSARAMVDRRLRVGAWTRVFLAELDAARAPAPPVAGRVLAWMGERQTQLADTIFAMDRRAKEAELARGGPDAIADAAVVNRIGQAAMLQAHTRFLVEALADAI
jgi:hypothetical protein